MTTTQQTLEQLSSAERLDAVEKILQGCSHLYSKGKLQREKLDAVMPVFMKLAEHDPYFLAHFLSYVITSTDNKDLKLVAAFVNSLSDADGTPFFAGSKYNKPNLRVVSQAALMDRAFDAKMIERFIEIAKIKQPLGTKHGHGKHLTSGMQTAIRKYIRYREANPRALEGIRKAAMTRRFRHLYQLMTMGPSFEAASILNWKQKGKEIRLADGSTETVRYWSQAERRYVPGPESINKKDFFNFKGLKDIEIAEKIRREKLSAIGALGALPEKISPVIAVAVLEQATGDQAVILREVFDSQGLLKHPEVMELFKQKIATAKTALDRVERINTAVDVEVTNVMKAAKAESRKREMGTAFGRVFVHIDVSSSMTSALALAKDYGSTIAECIPNPQENFYWGLFNAAPRILEAPKSFEKDAFHSALYGHHASGSTDLFACWDASRKLKCDLDIFITDSGHSGAYAQITDKILKAGTNVPKVIGIVQISGKGGYGTNAVADERNYENFKRAIEAGGLVVARINEDALRQSALVVQTLKQALFGKEALVEQILATTLLKLPAWYGSV